MRKRLLLGKAGCKQKGGPWGESDGRGFVSDIEGKKNKSWKDVIKME